MTKRENAKIAYQMIGIKPMRRWIVELLTALCLATPAVGMEVEDIPPSPVVKTALVVDAPVVKRGQAVAAGITFIIPEHWHIYWQNAGDSGIPTRLDWILPEGINAGEIEWPAPERIEMAGLVNYGYSNTVTLPVALMPLRDDVMGEVKVKASWLVCKDICIPESAELTARLNGDHEGAMVIANARARVPQPFEGRASFEATASAVTLTLQRRSPWGEVGTPRFSPVEDGIMANNPAGRMKKVGNELTLTLPRGAADAIAEWQGVLQLEQEGREQAWAVTAQNVDQVASPQSSVVSATKEEAPPPPRTTHRAPLTILLLAFLGGLILNLMPCVLPILALKALALAKKAQASRRAAMLQGVSYTAGVVASFLLIAGIMLALKATGSAIGWGFQLQNPVFVGILALVMLLVAANLLGLFHVPILFGEKATGVDDSRLRGSFLTGSLAVLVATPCTAPFMATAIGATLDLPAIHALAVFAVLGLGMAAPFLLISLWPAARRLLPKSGAWMHRFKQWLALPMLATAAWLLWVLVQLMSPATPTLSAGHEAYSAPRLAELRAAGTPVLVDATAAWCLSCKVNERVALKPDAMQKFFREKNVTMMVADWTQSDPEITEYLASFGRNGVPLYVYYPPHQSPVVLPQILTPSLVRGAIEQ